MGGSFSRSKSRAASPSTMRFSSSWLLRSASALSRYPGLAAARVNRATSWRHRKRRRGGVAQLILQVGDRGAELLALFLVGRERLHQAPVAFLGQLQVGDTAVRG